MQFALAHQTASADTEAELRSLITGLQVESDSSKDLVLSLQAELEKSQQKVIELEEQLRWQELESQNQLNIKEAKIQELKRGSNSGSDSKVSTRTIHFLINVDPTLINSGQFSHAYALIQVPMLIDF